MHGLTGRKFTEEHKKNISLARKGMKFSDEHRKNMSLVKKGKSSWNKGLSSWNKGLKGLKGHVAWNKGILNTDDYKRKMSEVCKKNKEKHWNWKGGITPLKRQIRFSFEMRLWRNEVFKRDNWKCVWCDKGGNGLNADHIKPFSKIIFENKITNMEQAINCNELWDINNGRTLCFECHKKTDSYLTKSKKVICEK